MDNQQTPILFPIEPEAYWEKIRDLIRSELARLTNRKESVVQYEVPGMVQKPLYKSFEVCAMLQISRQTLHTWVKDGILKPYKIKSRVFFLWSDLEKLIAPKDKI